MWTRIGCVLVGLCFTGGALAADKTFREDDDIFHDAGHWAPEGIPLPGDHIIIPLNRKCRVDDDATVETAEVYGELVIEETWTLTLQGHLCPLGPTCPHLDTSIVEGTIELEDGGTLSFTRRNHMFNGKGEIIAPVDNDDGGGGGKIIIASGVIFQNGDTNDQNSITGALEIEGDGTFRNYGKVEAIPDEIETGDDDWILISVNVVEDNDEATWVTNCQAHLVFLVGGCLEGDFNDRGVQQNGPGGEFKFDGATVHTLGVYNRSGCGPLDFENGGGFAFFAQVTGCPVDVTDILSGTCEDYDVWDADEDGSGVLCAGG